MGLGSCLTFNNVLLSEDMEYGGCMCLGRKNKINETVQKECRVKSRYWKKLLEQV